MRNIASRISYSPAASGEMQLASGRVGVRRRQARLGSSTKPRDPAGLAAERARGERVVAGAGGDTTRPEMEEVEHFKRHEDDSGSPEVQVALLTGRVERLTNHLKENPKARFPCAWSAIGPPKRAGWYNIFAAALMQDFACQRGLKMLLSQRFSQLKYLYRVDRTRYFDLIGRLGLKHQVART